MRPKTEQTLRLDCLKQAVIACGPSGKNAAQNVVLTAAAFYEFVSGSNFDEDDDGDHHADYEENVQPAVEERLGDRRPYTLRDLRRRS